MVKIPDLVGALEIGLRQGQETDTWGKDSVHMSDLAVVLAGTGDEKCMKQVWHRLNGNARSEDSLGTMMMFDNGHSIHDRLSKLIASPLLEQGWEIVGVEIPVTEFLPEWMQGTLDVELRGPEGEKVILDYKTTKSNFFRYNNGPKPSNVIQVQGYMMVTDADYGLLMYVDREGGNTPVVFIVERNDAAVIEGMNLLEKLKDLPEPPRRMLPKVKLQRNKGPDAVKLELPWQCQYCSFLDRSCKGALEPELRGQIVGYNSREGLTMKEQYEHLTTAVQMLLDGDV